MNTIKLDKGIIHLLLPFRLGSGLLLDVADIENYIWTKTDEDIPNLDFLLEHVKEFFTNSSPNSKVDDSSCFIMKLNKDSLPVKMFNNKTFWISNKPFDNQLKEKKLFKFPVHIDPGAFRIICHPFTSVAILLYSIELVKSVKNDYQPSLADFIQMNYILRLFNRHDEAFLISQNERPEERSKALNLLTNRIPNLFDKINPENISMTGWRPRQLINFLLQDLNARYKVKFFDHYRFFPVCYVQPTAEIKEEEIISQTLFFIRKVYDFDYTPAPGLLQYEGELLHPYKQIYYASSLEGSVVLNNCNSSDPEFVKAFFSNSFQKSLWLAILGLLQRSIFLQLMKEVSDIEPGDHQKVKEYLRRYTRILLKAIFSKVSVYHQHNDYYDLIIHNLQINDLQTELKDELHELNNLQRQFHEDEMERHEEIEKQYDKKLNVILFALSIFGLTQVTYAALGNTAMSIFQHSLAIGIPLLLAFIFWKILSFHKK